MSKILIVEDEGIVAKDIQNILKTLGYTVVGISSSSEDAIKKTDEMRPDLVLMDIVLDGNADGIETAKQIRNRFNIPIIYLTAFADEKTLQRAKITEPYGYILKPFQERELQITIEMGLYKHRIEKKLKDNEQYLNTTLLSIGDAVITTDTRGIITFMNPIAEILTGCTQKDCFGKSINKIFNIVNEKTGKKVESPVTKVLREGVIVGLANHTILIARDGKRISIDDSGAPIKDEKGNIIGVVLVFRDITKRRQTEDALQESEERYRTMIEKAHDMVWTLDTQANFTFFNHQSEVITGYKFENWKGKSFAPLIHPDDIETVTRVFQQTMLGKPQQYEVRIKGKYNEIVLSVNTAPIFKDEKIIGTVSFGRDITERKHAEEELLAEKEQLAVTLRSISDGMITTDIHGKIILINKVAEKLTGWNRADAIGMFLNDVFHIINEETGKKIKNPFEKVIKNNESVNIFDNTILVARDGTERNIEDSSAPIHNKDSKIIGSVLVFRDITEKRKMEYELQKAHKLESLGILASGIAHDFNNVITGIMGNISLALIHLSPNDQIFRYLTNAEKAVNQAKDLAQQLLTFSKGGAPLKNITSIIDLIKNASSIVLRGSNVRYELQAPDDLLSVRIDQGQISQVINNLIINADQAMPEGGIIKIKSENIQIKKNQDFPLPSGKYIKISIGDQGTGISEEYLNKIFDPFFTSKPNGNGLGLTICYSIIKKHNGYITVESKIGHGTIFYIYLPAFQDKMIETIKVEKNISTGKEKILVMDDEKIVRDVIISMLKHLGYNANGSEDGNEAIMLYKKAMKANSPFDIVIMDLTIPGKMGGKKAVKKLLEIDPSARVIVSSGYSNDPIMANYKQYGFKGFITKPYKIEELSEILHEVITDKN